MLGGQELGVGGCRKSAGRWDYPSKLGAVVAGKPAPAGRLWRELAVQRELLECLRRRVLALVYESYVFSANLKNRRTSGFIETLGPLSADDFVVLK